MATSVVFVAQIFLLTKNESDHVFISHKSSGGSLLIRVHDVNAIYTDLMVQHIPFLLETM